MCFVAAYGLQQRKVWAWYGGWVFLFFVAGAIFSYTISFFSVAESAFEQIRGWMFVSGGASLWSLFAVKWSEWRCLFRTGQPDPSADPGTGADDDDQ